MFMKTLIDISLLEIGVWYELNIGVWYDLIRVDRGLGRGDSLDTFWSVGEAPPLNEATKGMVGNHIVVGQHLHHCRACVLTARIDPFLHTLSIVCDTSANYNGVSHYLHRYRAYEVGRDLSYRCVLFWIHAYASFCFYINHPIFGREGLKLMGSQLPLCSLLDPVIIRLDVDELRTRWPDSAVFERIRIISDDWKLKPNL